MQAAKPPPHEGGADPPPPPEAAPPCTALPEIAVRNPDSAPRNCLSGKLDASRISAVAEMSPKENKPPNSGAARRTRASPLS